MERESKSCRFLLFILKVIINDDQANSKDIELFHYSIEALAANPQDFSFSIVIVFFSSSS
jgi:hypothetical protein